MDKKTPLYDEHVKLGGKMVSFGGWSLPVQYTGLADEHLNCRKNAGLFDVSHMGEFHVEGKDAEAYLQFLLTNDISKIRIGQAQYTLMCLESGGIVDDLIVYKRANDRFLLVVNASNADKDFKHAERVLREKFPRADLTLENKSDAYAQIAVQGPNAARLVELLYGHPLSEVKHYHFVEGRLVNEAPAILARTGYTGEDGFELYVPSASGALVWRKLLEQGADLGVKACGLGARDTLRLEMKYALYGNELNESTNPIDAGLGWVVKTEKPGGFLGAEAVAKAKAAGARKKLVGLAMKGRGIARSRYPVYSADRSRPIGEITSGTHSPSLGSAIAIAYVEAGQEPVGNKVSVKIRDDFAEAEVVSTPFITKEKKA